jgi:predicted signal transduction protein with EAL and GGDEF domain
MSVVLIAIIRRKTQGLSKMVAQQNFANSIDAEVVFFLSDTYFVLTRSGFLPYSKSALLISKEIYFFSTTLMCFFWFVYFEHMQGSPFVQSRSRVWASSVLVWVMGVLLVLNRFTGILFYVDHQGYHRGPLFLIQYLISYAYVFVTCSRALIGLFQKDRYADRSLLLSLAVFPIAPAAAGILQLVYPQLPVACAVLALCTLILYLNWLDQMISIDPLTKLNNRKQLLHHYQQWARGSGDDTPLYLLMIDANKFKQINDTYGHIQGDAALVRIADAL